jgi:hypothetical protein
MSIDPIGIRISGPLAGFAEGYGTELTQLGYAPASVRLQMKVLADLRIGSWAMAWSRPIWDEAIWIVSCVIIVGLAATPDMPRSGRCAPPLIIFSGLRSSRDVETTQVYLHADLAIKERALARTTPAETQPGRFRPTDKLLAFLEALWLCRVHHSDHRLPGRFGHAGRHNPELGIMHGAPLHRHAIPNGGDRALEPRAAIDDEQLGPLQHRDLGLSERARQRAIPASMPMARNNWRRYTASRSLWMRDGIVATIQTPLARVGFDSNRSGIGIRTLPSECPARRP